VAAHNGTSGVSPKSDYRRSYRGISSVHALQTLGELGKGDNDLTAFVPRASEPFPVSAPSFDVITLLSQAA
jgi:hypothetical protein